MGDKNRVAEVCEDVGTTQLNARRDSLSMARYIFLSPSLGSLPGRKYVPRIVMAASEYSLICANASLDVTFQRAV